MRPFAVVAILITSSSTVTVRADDLPPDVAEPVARAVFARAVEVYKAGEIDLARHLFREAWSADPTGPDAKTAHDLVKVCDQRLGLPVEELVAPAPPASQPSAGPLDPYATPPAPTRPVAPIDPYAASAPAPAIPISVKPLDPYAAPVEPAVPVDPYAPTSQPVAPPAPPKPLPPPRSPAATPNPRADADDVHTVMYVFGGLYGLAVGISTVALTNPSDGAVGLVEVLAGTTAGIVGGWLMNRNFDLRRGQADAIVDGAGWGMLLGGLAASMTAQSVPASGVATGVLLGSAGGFALGALYANTHPDDGVVAFVNSFALYGAAGGLLLSAALKPPDGRAVSLDTMIGAGVGIGVGFLLSPKDVSRGRMYLVDLGAACGAAASFVLVYPLGGANESSARWAAGLAVPAMLGGVVLAWQLSRPSAHVSLAPPAPTVIPTPDGVAAGVTLASGTF